MRESEPRPFPCYRARSAAHYVRSCSIIYILPDRADALTEGPTRQRPCWYAYGKTDAGIILLRTSRWHRTATQTDWFLLLCLQWPEQPLLLRLQLQFGTDLVLGKEQQSFLDGEDNYKAWGQALLKGGMMLRHCYGTVTDPSQGFGWRLGAVYIDASFPWPSSSPRLDILVYRQSNRTGLRDPCAMLVPRLTESLTRTI